jgi:hypothetical protein
VIAGPVASHPGSCLVDAYEALRQEVVNRTNGGYLIHGRALLMFKGMASWMKGVTETLRPTAAPAVRREPQQLPVGIERNLIDVVVAMTLANGSLQHDGTSAY